jgi:hypothetical protein
MADQVCTRESVKFNIFPDNESSHGSTTNSIATALSSLFYAILTCIIGIIVLAVLAIQVIQVMELISAIAPPIASNPLESAWEACLWLICVAISLMIQSL